MAIARTMVCRPRCSASNAGKGARGKTGKARAVIGSSREAKRSSAPAAPTTAAKTASPLVLEFDGPQGSKVYFGCDGPLQTCRPGNGGLRIWSYENEQAAIEECIGLSRGMTHKHDAYNTGFSGAKLVVNSEDPHELDKEKLMDVVAQGLNDLEGAIYTGCDLNTNDDDMEYLSSQSSYVLAGLNSLTDTNVATGHGVFGAIEGAYEHYGGLKGKKLLVHGTGKVGSTVARLLAQAGAETLTYDVFPAAADIPGCRNVSLDGDWRQHRVDCFVPCSISGVVDVATAKDLRCDYLIGAANLPFETEEARKICLDRGIVCVSEAVSSAGAILVDSVEQFDPIGYRNEMPEVVYAFVRHLTRSHTREMLKRAKRDPTDVSRAQRDLAVEATRRGTPVGAGLSAWAADATETCDVLVIGGGMAGTASAMEVSKSLGPGKRVTVLEAREIATAEGSSYGESRMYRRMYSQAMFSKMQEQALEMWREVEEASGSDLLRENGLLFYGETDTGETVEGSIPQARQTMEDLGIPHDHFASPAEMESRWPMVCREGDQGIYEHTAGSVHSSRACAAMAKLAQERGVSIREGEAVVDLSVLKDEKVQAVTSAGRVIRADKVIIAAGAWTNELLKMVGMELDLEVHNVHWGHYAIDPALAKDYPQWFCFRKPDEATKDGGLYYGFPAQGREPVIKVGIDYTPEELKTGSMEDFQRKPDPQIVANMDKFVKEHWKGVGERVDMFCSPYSMTKDTYFVMDTLPGLPQITVFTGASGRAFKFGPLIGKVLAELALGQDTCIDVSPFSAAREEVWKGNPALEPGVRVTSSA